MRHFVAESIRHLRGQTVGGILLFEGQTVGGIPLFEGQTVGGIPLFKAQMITLLFLHSDNAAQHFKSSKSLHCPSHSPLNVKK